MTNPETYHVNEATDDLALIAPSTTLNKTIFTIDNNGTRVEVPKSGRWVSTSKPDRSHSTEGRITLI